MEDDLDDQEFLTAALHAIDPALNLVSFSDGLKFMTAVEGLENDGLPKLIILDYNIPKLNGAGILEQLQQQKIFSAIPKIVWSTSDSEQYRQSCLAFGASAYFVKPSSISGINQLAQEFLSLAKLLPD